MGSAKLYRYLFTEVNTKALDKDLTDLYTSLYNVPLEVRTRKNGDFKFDLKPDKMIFYIGDRGNLFDPQDRYDELNRETMDNWVKARVEKYGHMFTEESIREEITSGDDFRSLISEWASKMDIPTPKLKLVTDKNRFGYFKANDKGSGDLSLNTYLRFMPEELGEQVIVHELCHAKQWFEIFDKYGYDQGVEVWNRKEDHGSDFWSLLSSYMPDYQDRVDQANNFLLEFYGITINDSNG